MAEKKSEFFKNKFGSIYGQNMETPKGRLMFPNLRQRNQMSNSFQVCLIFNQKDPVVLAGLKKMQAQGKLLFAEAGKAAKGYKYPALRKGDDQEKEEFHGQYYIQCKSKELPLLVDRDNNPLTPDDFQAGMLCRAIVQPVFFPAQGAGIAWKMSALRLVKDDGIRYFAGPDPKTLFSEEDEDAEEVEAEEDLDEAEVEEKPIPKKKAKAKQPEPEEDEELEEEESEEDEDLDEDSEEESDELEEDEELEEKPKKPAKKAAAVKSSAKVNGAAPTGKRGRPKKTAADEVMDIL